MAKRTSTVLQNLEAATDALRELGIVEREIERISLEVADKVAALNKQAEEELFPLQDRQKGLQKRIRAFATKHKKTLTEKGKTVFVSSGEFGWRLSPEKVVTKFSLERVLRALKRLGLRQYIRVKEELDKEAILRDRPKIPGVRIEQDEKFFIKPCEQTEEGERVTL